MTQSRMRLIDLLRYLQQQVLDRISREDEQDLAYLGTALAEFENAAEQFGDIQVVSILDNMKYAVSETLMGARFKGESVLPDIEAKLCALEATAQPRD